MDAAGILLAGAMVALAFASERGDPWPLVGLVLAVAAALVAGRVLGWIHRGIAPACLVLAGVVLIAREQGLVGAGPLSGPFGYRNATAAFFAQAAVAALVLGAAVRRPALWAGAGVVAVGFAWVAMRDSAAAAGTLVLVVLALLAVRGARGAGLATAVAGLAFVAVLGGTIALGAAYAPGDGGPAARALTERRLVLWHESLDLMVRHPGGVGPGRFAQVDRTARRDPDAGWAHQEFLQQGVELGWAGFALTVLLFVWGFARLLVHPAPDGVVALGAVALAALGIHAGIDHILHVAAVPVAAAALLGTAQAVPHRRSERVHHHARQ
ncbi:MAG TPA: hypothetical protein VE646_09015, partial [Actinomycetota bacterium]|nr:hypothetical protein [Actinomycetota bacterium]